MSHSLSPFYRLNSTCQTCWSGVMSLLSNEIQAYTLSRSVIHFFFIYLSFFLHPATTSGDSDRHLLRTHPAFRFLHQHARCPALLFISLRSVSFHLSLASITPIRKKKSSRRKILNTDYTSLIVLASPFQQCGPKGCWDPLLELLSPTSRLPPTHFIFFLASPMMNSSHFKTLSPY